MPIQIKRAPLVRRGVISGALSGRGEPCEHRLRAMTLEEQRNAPAGRAARLRAHATVAGKEAGAATQKVGARSSRLSAASPTRPSTTRY